MTDEIQCGKEEHKIELFPCRTFSIKSTQKTYRTCKLIESAPQNLIPTLCTFEDSIQTQYCVDRKLNIIQF